MCFFYLRYPRGTIWLTPTEDLPKTEKCVDSRKSEKQQETLRNTIGISLGVEQKILHNTGGINVKSMSKNSAELLMDPRHMSLPFLSNVVQGGEGG